MICDSRFESQIAIAVKSRDLEHLADSSLQGNAGKFQKFRISEKKERSAEKRPIQEIREIHSGDPKWACWDIFFGRMGMAKVDMLGTGDIYL